MALGIDDVLSAATGGVKLLSTVSKTIEEYKKKKQNPDLAQLLEEVRIVAIARIDEADLALSQFERTMVENGVPMDKPLYDVIANTPFWRPFQSLRLKQMHKKFNAFADSIYSATDDIAALVRCQQSEGPMGSAILEAFEVKRVLQADMLGADSLKEAIQILRVELSRQKQALSR
jgi:hypothetical protein